MTEVELGAEKVTQIEPENGTDFEEEKVTEIESKRPTKNYTTSFKVQSYFNTVVHILNGVVACVMTLYLIREVRNDWPSTNDTFPLHAWLCTIGYQVFMAEAILVYYAPNSWSYFLSYKVKRHLHWILHTIGAIFIISGNVLISVIRTTPHFTNHYGNLSIHSVAGLISMILLAMTILQGVWAYFAYDLRTYMKPVTSRFLHNLVALLCFVFGMISLCFGYPYGADHGAFDSIEVEYSLYAIAAVTTVFSVIGAVRSGWRALDKIQV
ncbi:uncharacterized protein LOC119085128 [Bradysia coprophila]|uniref:uncharacterized protein LOC119085128 n=1 Tax=Bradysia coprophila TaxID=38358 RepID=UPI00187DB1EE|nr:uncharacterized protein LOC119085128 [Bradysia coprophila]